MKATLHRLFKLTCGWCLVFIGIIGWFTPILPGTPFVILGLVILSAQSEWVRDKIEALIEYLRIRFPRQAARLQALKAMIASKMRKEGSP